MIDDGWNDPAWREAAREYHEQRELYSGNGHDTLQKNAQLEISRLAKLSLVEYERERGVAAKRLEMRSSVLDRAVEIERKKSGDDNRQGRPLNLPEPVPWLEPVDGAQLLSDISSGVRRYVVMPDHALDACALWVLHTHLIGFFDISPRLAITSPEKQCGKTTTIDVLTRLVWRPLPTANTTAAAIFRVVEMLQPTLFIDEADTFLPENDELRGILNSGHRRNGSVLRTIGDDHEPRAFPTFSACAIAMIGKLPGTLADRSVPIELQRRLAGEPIESFRSDRTGHLDQLARKAARWAADNGERLCGADPMMPPGIFNRVADNWRSLLAIADLAGGDWPARARRALEVIQLSVEDESIRVQLLTDIRTVFSERAVDRLLSGDLVAALVNMEGRSWAEWKGGKPLSTHGLARLLKPLKIRPGTKRLGDETAKGYYLSQFDEAFRRYLGQNGRPKPSHRHDVDEMGTTDPFNPAHPGSDVTDEKCKKPSNHNDCDGVTDASGERPALGPPGDSLDDFR